jgi:pimeloyl-ACP methyl ester carboxylesterase
MTVKKKAAKYITPLHMNKMHGRMMRLPPRAKNKEILLVYGHHASLERVYGMAEYLNRYGAVTVPDLPGFGGMDSLYKIGREPTVDAVADYLASFIKLQYKRRRLVIIGMSFSVPVITRMLQKYPSITKKVDLFVSYVGFVHKDDFSIKRMYYWGLYGLSTVLSSRLAAAIVKGLVLRKTLLSLIIRLSPWVQYKFDGLNEMKRNELAEFEIELWQINDFRTRLRTLKEMLTLDLCDRKVNMPVCQIGVKDDRYFDNKIVEQHMQIIFSDCLMIEAPTAQHAPSILADAKEIAGRVPNRARQIIRRA